MPEGALCTASGPAGALFQVRVALAVNLDRSLALSALAGALGVYSDYLTRTMLQSGQIHPDSQDISPDGGRGSVAWVPAYSPYRIHLRGVCGANDNEWP